MTNNFKQMKRSVAKRSSLFPVERGAIQYYKKLVPTLWREFYGHQREKNARRVQIYTSRSIIGSINYHKYEPLNIYR